MKKNRLNWLKFLKNQPVRFHKPETEKTEPKLKKPSQTEKIKPNRKKPNCTEPEPVGLNRFLF
jgi:hypothetical protein